MAESEQPATPRSARRWWLPGAFAVGLVVALGVVALPRWTARVEPPTLSVTENACGQGWTDPRPGPARLLLRNTGQPAADAQLIDATTGNVVVEADEIGSGATVPVQVDLVAGRYALRCVFDAYGAVTGPVVDVPGAAGRRPPGVAPVTRNDLAGPVAAYRATVAAGMAPLVADADALRSAVRSGDRAAARRGWLPAMLDYQRLGAAYGAFGELDREIDGGPDGLPGGVDDPGWAGLRRLEYGLWHDQPVSALGPVADALVASVRALRDADLRIDPLDYTRRAHEILEDTARFELTGAADQGSGTSLAVAAAQVQATQLALEPLLPLLATRYPDLPQVDPALRRLASDLDAARHDGAWTPVAALDHAARQRINADAGRAVELLAPVAVICEPRRTS